MTCIGWLGFRGFGFPGVVVSAAHRITPQPPDVPPPVLVIAIELARSPLEYGR
jgi:hypothetical protein